jgi:hypothetical protein
MAQAASRDLETAQRIRLKARFLSLIGSAIALFSFNSLPLAAAEKVILKYSILRESISVEELGVLARTGEPSDALKSYLNLAKKEPKDLQTILYLPVAVEPVFISKLLNSYPGELLLDRLSEVIHTPSGRASRESLRGALITSALNDRNVRLIEVLENYPTAELHVDGDRLMEIYQHLKKVTEWIPQLPF